MGAYKIKYRIENNYKNTVRKALYNLLVLPFPSDKLKIVSQSFTCSIEEGEHRFRNCFGFEIVQYYINHPFSEFWFELHAEVVSEEVNPYGFLPSEVETEKSILSSVEFMVDNSMYLRQTPLTESKFDSADFPKLDPNISVFDYLLELNKFIYNYMSYIPGVTDTTTPVSQIMDKKAGVCQDFAHLFLHICRRNSIPCRYVSGYLYQGGGLVGAGQLHAWVEALVPEVGWIGLDPTNNLLIDRHYIKIAHGTDYRDCSPITGVLENTGEQVSKHSVVVNNQ